MCYRSAVDTGFFPPLLFILFLETRGLAESGEHGLAGQAGL